MENLSLSLGEKIVVFAFACGSLQRISQIIAFCNFIGCYSNENAGESNRDNFCMVYTEFEWVQFSVNEVKFNKNEWILTYSKLIPSIKI